MRTFKVWTVCRGIGEVRSRGIGRSMGRLMRTSSYCKAPASRRSRSASIARSALTENQIAWDEGEGMGRWRNQIAMPQTSFFELTV